MEIVYILLGLIIILAVIAIYFAYKASSAKEDTRINDLKYQIESIKSELPKIDNTIKSEISTNRSESNSALKETREELGKSFIAFSEILTKAVGTTNDAQKNQLESFSTNLQNLTTAIDTKLKEGTESSIVQSKEIRKELKENLDLFKSDLNTSLSNFNDRQKDNFSAFTQSQNTQNVAMSEKITNLNTVLEKNVKNMQESNEKKLEEMRKTVDEKLNDTLEKRLGESFKLVSERLEAVHKGLGDMQSLATNVGDLKKVMSNVKSRGILGEYQLHSILEDLLTNDQYAQNVKTKAGSGAVVEFAIRMPNGNNLEKTLWLPIDSKFPKEDYEALNDAYDDANPEKIEILRKAFKNSIIKNAKDIKEKYIDPPNTTEYGIMFLPFESLFAEVLRTPGLFELLQKDYKITITGPTTLSALLNSLQMGFRTLAIEKRSSEVWDLLGAVKTEFGQFGTILEKTKKKLDEASNVIESAGVRSRAIERKLKNVQELPQADSKEVLEEIEDNFLLNNEE